MTSVEVRRASPDDHDEMLAVLEASLGWVPDGAHREFFAWKHQENPFGVSPAFVATMDGRIVGVRMWLRWAFRHRGQVVRAVRAVDTATHPDARGQGVFTRLTMSSLDDLADDGVAFVFNTPNEQSRPGYLKMGWEQVGRLPVSVRVSSPGSLRRMAGARVAADKWSLPSDHGQSAPEALADPRLRSLLDVEADRDDETYRTDLSRAFLDWRYRLPGLAYRGAWADDGSALALYRLRRRGTATEGVVGHVLAADDGARRRLLRQVGRSLPVDHLLVLGRPVGVTSGFVPVKGLGPVLTWRAVSVDGQAPRMAGWELHMGDVELF